MKSPNALWHIDGNHKLIRSDFITWKCMNKDLIEKIWFMAQAQGGDDLNHGLKSWIKIMI